MCVTFEELGYHSGISQQRPEYDWLQCIDQTKHGWNSWAEAWKHATGTTNLGTP